MLNLIAPLTCNTHWSWAAGMQFGQLFRICRENFIVSNDMALRSHLNEFKDHQLLYTEYAPLVKSLHAMNIVSRQAVGTSCSHWGTIAQSNPASQEFDMIA